MYGARLYILWCYHGTISICRHLIINSLFVHCHPCVTSCPEIVGGQSRCLCPPFGRLRGIYVLWPCHYNVYKMLNLNDIAWVRDGGGFVRAAAATAAAAAVAVADVAGRRRGERCLRCCRRRSSVSSSLASHKNVTHDRTLARRRWHTVRTLWLVLERDHFLTRLL